MFSGSTVRVRARADGSPRRFAQEVCWFASHFCSRNCELLPVNTKSNKGFSRASWFNRGRLVLTLMLALPLVMLACSAIGILRHSDLLKWHELRHEPPSYPPIDLVIPWSGEQTSTNTRQRDNGELRYGLRSYAKHAPWLRHIHILQNGDQPPPSFMEPNDWISRVDRCQLFTNASHCPTYNGHAANTVIPRIPGLTEHFIVADDDIFLTAPSKPSHWFTADGRPIVRTTYKQQPIYSKEYVGIDRKLILKHPEWPTMKWSKYTHQIRPLRRSWIREFEAKHPGFHE